MNTIPVPHDIPLPLPLPELILKLLIIVSFLVHILFVNLMIGGTLLTIFFQIKGLQKAKYDLLAKEISKTITVNKSLAVVLGVAPLLIINTLYTVYFYSANALTGYAWITIIPLVTLAFLLLYLHKFTWNSEITNRVGHISLAGLAALIFLFIPLIFFANINLMLFPEKWLTVKGFWSTLLVGNVFPRYLHFISASIALTALFFVGYFRRTGYNVEKELSPFTREELKKQFYQVAFWVTVFQLGFGPLVLFTLPGIGISWQMVTVILFGAALAIGTLILMWYDMKEMGKSIGQHLGKVVIGLTIVIVFMVSGRHMYRENALTDHKKLVKEKTEKYLEESKRALEEYKNIETKKNP
jgi:cytochrome c